MKKMCENYRTRDKVDIFDGMPYEQGYCLGTKEQECCDCGGDETKCDFYSYIRERALSQQATKTLNAYHEYITKLPQNTNTTTIKYEVAKTYMTKAEIVYIVNEAASKQNKIVPAEFYERLFGGK